MPMPPYIVLCSSPECGQPALYKISARWSDGVTAELKTYAMSCASCLNAWLASSREKQRACRLAPGEMLEPPGIYRLQRHAHDRELERLVELESATMNIQH